MLLWSVLVSLAGAGLAYIRRDLTGNGFWGAVAVGTLIAYFGGWAWFAILAVFFISSSWLTSFKTDAKRDVQQDFAKGRPRDLGQVLANGFLGAILAVLFAAFDQRPVFFIAFLGVMATTTADTWATELGVLGRGRVWSIWSGQLVKAGTSGGVSLVGILAGLAGALTVGLAGEIGVILAAEPIIPVRYPLIAATNGGFFGCMFDSLLGATLQSRYRCTVCQKVTEKNRHCEEECQLVGGWAWMNNDLVNFISSLLGGLVAVLFIMLYLIIQLSH